MEMTCAQCGVPFVMEPTTRACPHCSSMKAARCRECGEPISLVATTCVRHSLLGQEFAYRDADGPPLAPPPWAGAAATAVAEPSPARRPRRRWPAVAALLLILGAAGGGVALLGRGPGHPRRWDARIVDLVSFVERERGLPFEHPVRVDFLGEEEFRKLVTSEEEPTEEEKAQLESFEAMLRAVGYLSGDLDLQSVGDELSGDGTIGIYLIEEERIAVRGSTLDDERRSTLVHELTHALQDQHFDIGDYEPEDSGEDAAFTAVIEADAERVQDAWLETLSDAARAALEEAQDETTEEADFAGVPPVLIELMGSPYLLGPAFLDAVIAERGESGRDDVLRQPPTTEEHILLPKSYLAGDHAATVRTPALKKGETLIEDSETDFGMLSLLVLLGERLDFSVAWPAVQGWAGDSAVGFERQGTTCVRASVEFDAADQASRFRDAVAAWAGGLTTVQTDLRDRTVHLESCDPGPEQPGRAEGHVSGLQGLGLRQTFLHELESNGVPPEPSQCIADGVLGRVGANRMAELDRLISESGDLRAGREVALVTAEVAEGCR